MFFTKLLLVYIVLILYLSVSSVSSVVILLCLYRFYVAAFLANKDIYYHSN